MFSNLKEKLGLNTGSTQTIVTGDGKVIALLNQKGGVGKTTLAFNIAHALSKQGKKVLCIDMDPQANLSLLFNVDSSLKSHNMFHLMINTVRELKTLHTAVNFADVVESVGDIDLLPAGQDLSGFELSVSGITGARQLILKQFIEKNGLKAHYDHIIIDGPPTLGLLVVNILCAADGVLIPFQPDQFSRKGLAHFHEVLENISDMGVIASPKILGYIPNLVENRRKQVSVDFDQIKTDLKEARVFGGLSNKVQLVTASANKKSVFDYKGAGYLELQEQFGSIATHVTQELAQ